MSSNKGIIAHIFSETAKGDGKPYENNYCFVIRMRNGKMVEIEEYCDTELVTSALGSRI
jgi:ketosteroid isomerase-like protein